jgi:pyridoxamine 5'-phosphate oxidase
MIPSDDIASLRKEYKRGDLIESTIPGNPMQLFSEWFIEAGPMGIIEPNAMILSTVSQDGKPSSRTVLLKGIEAEAFVFFTNYESRKAVDIAQNHSVSLLFLWLEAESAIIANREELESRFKEMEERFKDQEEIPMPDFWGGYAIAPSSIEFWQGRIGRLHDRIVYEKNGDTWTQCRLNP